MYKLKTNRSIKKRFQFTGSGKILKRRAFRNHLLQKKSNKRKRKLRRVRPVICNGACLLMNSLNYTKLN